MKRSVVISARWTTRNWRQTAFSWIQTRKKGDKNRWKLAAKCDRKGEKRSLLCLTNDTSKFLYKLKPNFRSPWRIFPSSLMIQAFLFSPTKMSFSFPSQFMFTRARGRQGQNWKLRISRKQRNFFFWQNAWPSRWSTRASWTPRRRKWSTARRPSWTSSAIPASSGEMPLNDVMKLGNDLPFWIKKPPSRDVILHFYQRRSSPEIAEKAASPAEKALEETRANLIFQPDVKKMHFSLPISFSRCTFFSSFFPLKERLWQPFTFLCFDDRGGARRPISPASARSTWSLECQGKHFLRSDSIHESALFPPKWPFICLETMF